LKVYKISDKNLIETSFESSIEDNKEKYWIIINPEELQKNNKLFKCLKK
jgi:hypothetical protein